MGNGFEGVLDLVKTTFWGEDGRLASIVSSLPEGLACVAPLGLNPLGLRLDLRGNRIFETSLRMTQCAVKEVWDGQR